MTINTRETSLVHSTRQQGALINKLLSGRSHLSQWRKKEMTTGDKKENCYYFCLWAYKIKINFFYVVRRAPEHY
jgi:hypothetical protein